LNCRAEFPADGRRNAARAGRIPRGGGSGEAEEVRNSGVLVENSGDLAQISGVLVENSSVLGQITGVLAQISGDLGQNSGVLVQISGVLE
jgi:hypothetical protein